MKKIDSYRGMEGKTIEKAGSLTNNFESVVLKFTDGSYAILETVMGEGSVTIEFEDKLLLSPSELFSFGFIDESERSKMEESLSVKRKTSRYKHYLRLKKEFEKDFEPIPFTLKYQKELREKKFLACIRLADVDDFIHSLGCESVPETGNYTIEQLTDDDCGKIIIGTRREMEGKRAWLGSDIQTREELEEALILAVIDFYNYCLKEHRIECQSQ